MQLLFSSGAVASYINTKMTKFGLLFFEGTPPATLGDIPFDPTNFEAAVKAACCASKGNTRALTYDVENQRLVVEAKQGGYTTQKDHLASFQYVPSEYVIPNTSLNFPVARVYGEDRDGYEDPRSLSYMVDFQHVSALYQSSQGAISAWWPSDYFWTYFEYPEELTFSNFYFARSSSSSGNLTIQYLDSEDGLWKDITGRGLGEDDRNIYVAFSNRNHYLDQYRVFVYRDGSSNRYTYRIQLDAAVTTKKLRVKVHSTSATAATSRMYSFYNFAVGVSEDLSHLHRTVTPTWGIAYPLYLLSAADKRFFVFSVSDTEESDLQLPTATIDPKTFDFKDDLARNLMFSAKELV